METNQAGVVPEISIAGIEYTQGIQYYLQNGQGSGYAANNSIPLIELRQLVLRVYIDLKRPQGSVPVPVYITGSVVVDRILDNGSTERVTVLSPINGPIVGRSAAFIDRGNANHTLNFRLIPVYCQGYLRFTTTVKEQGPIVTEHNDISIAEAVAVNTSMPDIGVNHDVELAAGSALSTSRGFARLKPMPIFHIRGVLIHYLGGGMDLPAPTGVDFLNTLKFITRTYPVGRVNFVDCIEVDFEEDVSRLGGGCGPGWEGPNGLLTMMRNMANASNDYTTIYVALLPEGIRFPSALGCGNTRVAAAFNGSGEVLAQEVGHALSRKHAPACGAPGPDPNYPVYDSYPSGSIGEYGFDTYTSTVFSPELYYDFMGYCPRRWVSPYTYMGLRTAIMNLYEESSAARMTERENTEVLFLNFLVYRDGKVDVKPSFHLPADAQPAIKGALSNICVELLDQEGEVLAFHRCHLSEPPRDLNSPYILYNEQIRWFEQATSIRFLRNREVLYIHRIEEHGPQIELTPSILASSAHSLNLQMGKYQSKAPANIYGAM